MKTTQLTQILEQMCHGDIALSLAKESHPHPQVLITLQSQNTNVFGNQICTILVFILIATVTLMTLQ